MRLQKQSLRDEVGWRGSARVRQKYWYDDNPSQPFFISGLFLLLLYTDGYLILNTILLNRPPTGSLQLLRLTFCLTFLFHQGEYCVGSNLSLNFLARDLERAKVQRAFIVLAYSTLSLETGQTTEDWRKCPTSRPDIPLSRTQTIEQNGNKEVCIAMPTRNPHPSTYRQLPPTLTHTKHAGKKGRFHWYQVTA